MEIKVRYVTRRVKPSGRVLWYWQRKGFPLTRLPDDESERLAMATRLNEEADARMAGIKGTTLPEDSVTRVIRDYEQSDRYLALKPGSRRYHDRHLRLVQRTFGDLPFSALTRRVVVDYCHGHTSRSERHKAASVLSNLFELAMYHGLVSINETRRLRLESGKPRDKLWSAEDIDAFLDAADRHRHAGLIRLYFTLLRFTAQRPGDALAMTWKQYNGGTIRLTQEKTNKLLEVPCHRELREALDSCERRSIHILATGNGAPPSYQLMRNWEAEVRKDAGLMHLQMRDLRRTAMVRMGEAGAEIQQIASVSGHSIEKTRHILETYLPRTVTMARAAIDRWESEESKR